MVLGRARVLAEGVELTILSAGICTEESIAAVAAIEAAGASVNHLHISTLKPFTDPAVIDAIANARRGVITVENHSVIGGLGSAVAEVMAEAGVGRPLRRVGIKDTYAHGASRAYLMAKYEIDAAAVVRAAADLVGQPIAFGTGPTEHAAPERMSSRDEAL
jgi:transketolase